MLKHYVTPSFFRKTALLVVHQLCLGIIGPDSAFCIGLLCESEATAQHKGQHDVGHFGNATEHGVFTDAGPLAVITWMR